MIETEFLNKAKFTKMVEEAVYKKRLSYIDAIVHICDETNIEPEDVNRFITSIVKDKIEAEARSLNYLPKQNTLPV
tara:strand:+ start:728 stop:955 length:228 start_codon:yes stop_codon:yes gene_type:complete